MARIGSYHRPTGLDEALSLLARPGIVTALLAGGTQLNRPSPDAPEEVVDLQALGLDAIDRDDARITVGAMVTLQEVADSELIPPILRELAQRSAPSTIRNMATVGGAVASGDRESPFLAGLLAYGASVMVARQDGVTESRVDDVLSNREALGGAVITSAVFDSAGTAAWAATGRTPADTPIVLVAGVRDDGGNVQFAATGVGPTPVTIRPTDLGNLDPAPDFRGSREYRLDLVSTLVARVQEKLGDR